MAGTGIQSFAKFRAQILPRNTNFRTMECQGLKAVDWFVVFREKFMSGTVRSVAFRGQILPRSWSKLAIGGWHSTVCLSAECQGLKTVARFVAFRRNLSAELGKRLNSSTRHFTSKAPLFVAS
jgi:hypothetical protein